MASGCQPRPGVVSGWRAQIPMESRWCVLSWAHPASLTETEPSRGVGEAPALAFAGDPTPFPGSD